MKRVLVCFTFLFCSVLFCDSRVVHCEAVWGSRLDIFLEENEYVLSLDYPSELPIFFEKLPADFEFSSCKLRVKYPKGTGFKSVDLLVLDPSPTPRLCLNIDATGKNFLGILSVWENEEYQSHYMDCELMASHQ